MLLFIAKWLSIYALSWILWKVLHKHIFPSKLDNLPGPKPSSFWFGTFFCDAFNWDNISYRFEGSVAELQNINAWGFHKAIADKCNATFLRPVSTTVTR